MSHEVWPANSGTESSAPVRATATRRTASCGCAEGRIGLVLGLVLFVLVVVFNPWSIQVMQWRTALLGVGMAVAGGLAGKIFGMRRARPRIV